jgi:hypothetical protein
MPAAHAFTYPVYLIYNGDHKATATYSQESWELCAQLRAGYSATAVMDGNSITDYSANGVPSCKTIHSPILGRQYTLTIRWQGTGGAFKENSGVVTA